MNDLRPHRRPRGVAARPSGREELVVVEGRPDAMELLGRLLIAQAHYEREWGLQIDRKGTLITADSTHGLFLHVLRDEGPT